MKESKYIRKLLTAFAILALVIPAIASSSQFVNAEGKTVVRVSYSDLNLSSEADLDALYSRLQAASSSYCGPQRSLREAGSLRQLIRYKQCYSHLLSKLVAKVGNADLTEMHIGYPTLPTLVAPEAGRPAV